MIHIRAIKWVERHPVVGNVVLGVMAMSFVAAVVRAIS